MCIVALNECVWERGGGGGREGTSCARVSV